MVEEWVEDKTMALNLAIEIIVIEMVGEEAFLLPCLLSIGRNNEVNHSCGQDTIYSRVQGASHGVFYLSREEEEGQVQDVYLAPVLMGEAPFNEELAEVAARAVISAALSHPLGSLDVATRRPSSSVPPQEAVFSYPPNKDISFQQLEDPSSSMHGFSSWRGAGWIKEGHAKKHTQYPVSSPLEYAQS